MSPSAIRWLALPCRMSWIRVSAGSPARSRRRLNPRIRFWALIGVPTSEASTRQSGVTSRDVHWWSIWRRSAAITVGSRLIVRPPFAVFEGQ